VLLGMIRALSNEDKEHIDNLNTNFRSFIAHFGRGISVETLISISTVTERTKALRESGYIFKLETADMYYRIWNRKPRRQGHSRRPSRCL